MGQPVADANSPEDSLTVRDNRTGKVYNIPYVAFRLICIIHTEADSAYDSISNNTVPATTFKLIAAPRKKGEREENETEKGLRVADKGFLNTAVITSEITYIDGDAGGE